MRTRTSQRSGVPRAGPPRVMLLLESSRASGRAMLRGIARYAHLHGPWSFAWEPAGLEKAWPLIARGEADGVILRDVGRLEDVLSTGVPAVVVGHSRDEVAGVVNVITDAESISRLATEHLLERGLRHFGYCGAARSAIERIPWSRDREAWFSRFLAEHDLAVNAFSAPASRRRPSWRQEQQALARWLQQLPRPAGVFAANDDRGLEVIEACRAAGLRVPDDIAVLGVDNDELVSGLSNPPMSSVAVNFERAGYECAEALDAEMHRRRRRPRRILVRASHVVERHSTNFLAVQDAAVARALEFIRREARRPLLVPEVARAAGLSRRALELRFRAQLGCSVFQAIRRARVEQIVRLLADTQHSIAEIAERLGFDGPQHFARYFRAEKGMTPREFRRLCSPT